MVGRQLTGAKRREPDSRQTTLIRMSKNEAPPAPETLDQPIAKRGIPRKWKSVLALCLGVVGPFVWFVLAETVGGYAMYIGPGGYFLLSQYFLSSGNPQALRSDWPCILRLNFWMLCMTVVLIVWQKEVHMLWLAVLGCTLACSCAGAALAALAARIARH